MNKEEKVFELWRQSLNSNFMDIISPGSDWDRIECGCPNCGGEDYFYYFGSENEFNDYGDVTCLDCDK